MTAATLTPAVPIGVAAALIGRTRRTVRTMIRDGRLVGRRETVGRVLHWYVTRESLATLLAPAGGVPLPAPPRAAGRSADAAEAQAAAAGWTWPEATGTQRKAT